MRHLRIQQSNITELSNYKIIRKLHELIDNNELDNSSSLSGVISSNYVYDEDFDYFSNLYNNFQIIYNIDRIISFEDPLVEQLLLTNNIGHTEYNFITYGDVANISNIPSSVTKSNNGITSFNEFRFFTLLTRAIQEQFSYDLNLVSIQYPSSIISLDAKAHEHNESLSNIKIDNTNISKIGQGAFWGCTSLTSIVLPSTCATLDSWAFNECSNLKSINLQNVITLKSYVFQNCAALDIDISHDLSNVESIETTAFINCTSLKGDLSLPNLTYIGGDSFKNCTGITSVSNLGSITTLDSIAHSDSAFGPFINCTGLISVVLPSTLTLIKENSFSGCTSLKTISGGNNVTRLLSGAFHGCTSLETVEFDFEKITEIGWFAFCNCQKLNIETLSMPNLTGELGGRSFENCKKIKHITSLGSITKMAASYNAGAYWGPFHDCTGLISVNLPSTCTALDGRCFSGCTSLTTINLNNVTKIGAGCFMGCTSLASVDLTNCTTIEGSAFQGCTSLTELNTDFSKLESLHASAFQNTGLIKADLSKSKIPRMNGSCFRYCTSLTEIRMPKTVTYLSDYWNPDNIDNIKIVGLENVTNHDTYNWGIFAKNVLYPIALKNVTIHMTPVSTGRDNKQYCHSLFLPKVLESLDGYGSYYSIPLNSAFQSQSHQNGRLTLKLLYYRDIQTFGYAHFLDVLVDNLVINNVTPPQYRTTEVAADYFPEWQSLNGDGSRCTIGTIWVPDSAVNTYKADPVYAHFNIKGINSQTNGQYDLPRWATFEDWETDALECEAQNLDYPVGLIEEWM